MKSLLLFCSFYFAVLFAFCQTTKDLSGKYISNRRFGDVWTLILNSDSTYNFNSKVGESIQPGSWTTDRNRLILSHNSMGKAYLYIFKINFNSKETKLKCKTKPFKRMKLNVSK